MNPKVPGQKGSVHRKIFGGGVFLLLVFWPIKYIRIYGDIMPDSVANLKGYRFLLKTRINRIKQSYTCVAFSAKCSSNYIFIWIKIQFCDATIALKTV